MLAAERMTKIVEIVDSRGIVSVKELSDLLNVSLMTARRDLSTLERHGMVRRTHGGVLSMKYNRDAPYGTRSRLDVSEKSAIGRKAAEMVEEGDVVFLGSGTTVAHMASALSHKVGLTIVTSSFQIVNELAGEQGITLIFLGGIVKGDTYSTVGQTAERELANYHFQKAFLGVSGILPDKGVFNSDFLISAVEKVVVAKSQKIFVLADHTKFARSALVHICPMEQVTGIITDSSLPAGLVKSLQQARIPILQAGTP